MQSGMSPPGIMMMTSGTTLNGSLKSTKQQKGRKVKGKDLSLKGSPKARMHRDLSLQGRLRLHLREVIDPKPKPSPKHVHA